MVGLSATTPDSAASSAARPVRERLLKCLLRLAQVSVDTEDAAPSPQANRPVMAIVADLLREVRQQAVKVVSNHMDLFFPTSQDKVAIIAQLLNSLHPDTDPINAPPTTPPPAGSQPSAATPNPAVPAPLPVVVARTTSEVADGVEYVRLPTASTRASLGRAELLAALCRRLCSESSSELIPSALRPLWCQVGSRRRAGRNSSASAASPLADVAALRRLVIGLLAHTEAVTVDASSVDRVVAKPAPATNVGGDAGSGTGGGAGTGAGTGAGAGAGGGNDGSASTATAQPGSASTPASLVPLPPTMQLLRVLQDLLLGLDPHVQPSAQAEDLATVPRAPGGIAGLGGSPASAGPSTTDSGGSGEVEYHVESFSKQESHPSLDIPSKVAGVVLKPRSIERVCHHVTCFVLPCTTWRVACLLMLVPCPLLPPLCASQTKFFTAVHSVHMRPGSGVHRFRIGFTPRFPDVQNLALGLFDAAELANPLKEYQNCPVGASGKSLGMLLTGDLAARNAYLRKTLLPPKLLSGMVVTVDRDTNIMWIGTVEEPEMCVRDGCVGSVSRGTLGYTCSPCGLVDRVQVFDDLDAGATYRFAVSMKDTPLIVRRSRVPYEGWRVADVGVCRLR